MRSIDRRGFTLVELMVVLGMVGMLIGAMASSVSGAQQRAKIAKAESEVKVISQAILAYENYDKNNELPTMVNRQADRGALAFIIGQGQEAQSGGKIPATLMAALADDGTMRDPWNTPYTISIRQSAASINLRSASGAMQSGFMYPNYYRLSGGERK